jgi:hypothetical protein
MLPLARGDHATRVLARNVEERGIALADLADHQRISYESNCQLGDISLFGSNNAVRFAAWSRHSANRGLLVKRVEGGDRRALRVARAATREFEPRPPGGFAPESPPLAHRRVTCTRLSSCTYHPCISSVMCTRRPALRYNVIQYEILFPLPLSFASSASLCVCARVCRSHPLHPPRLACISYIEFD